MERRQVAWAAAAIVFGGAPHLFAVAPWISLLVLLIALWRIAAAAYAWPLPSLWIRLPVTILGFIGVAVTYRGIAGIEAGSALLLVMAGMKLLETRAERDRVLVVLIGYFLLFAVFLREQAIGSLTWFAVGALGITAALVQNTRRERLLTVTAALTLSGRLLLHALPVAVLLFVLFPRLPGPFWAMPNTRLAGISGLPESIEPGDITQLSLSDEVAFRVRFDERAPPAEVLYWRGPVLERFDGRRWSARPMSPRLATPAPRAVAAGFAYEMVLEPQGNRWLLALETPVSWSAPRAVLGPARQLMSTEALWDRTAYRARSVPGPVIEAEPATAQLQANVQLPADRNPRTLQLARRMRAAAGNDRAFLRNALGQFADEPFRYSLAPPPLGTHSVDEFLFATRNGFCEHYASALAVMARAAGIPARVVTGYQGGERHPFADYWIVRQANAHAWVEVWLEGAWERVDPTTAVAPERIENGIEPTLATSPSAGGRLWRTSLVVNRLVLSWDAVNAAWDRWVLAFGPEAQQDLLRALGFTFPKTIQLTLLAAVATMACMLAMALALRWRDGYRPDPAAALYRGFCQRLARVVRPRAPGETPSHYASAVAAVRPDLAAQVRAATEAYLQLRYGGPAHAGQLHRLARLVRTFRPRPVPAPP